MKKINYNKKDYVNPFFKKRKRVNISIGSSFKNKVFFILLGLLLVFVLYFLFFSDFFTISKYEINGLVRTSESEVESEIKNILNQEKFLIFKTKNFFLLNKEEIRDELYLKYSFEKITVKKKLPNTLIFNMQEKARAVIWNEGEKYYYSDIDGFLINEVNPLDIKRGEYPLIKNESDYHIEEKKISIEDISNKLNYIIKLDEEFKKVSGLLNVKKDDKNISSERYFLTNDINTVWLKITDGPYLYFNILETTEKQLNKLMIIINEKLKQDFFQKEYIDLRYGEKVYYR
jgi:hypothetical protein